MHNGKLRPRSAVADELSAQQYASKLTRTFSLQDRDSSGIDQKELSNLQKVNHNFSFAVLLQIAHNPSCKV